MRDNTPPETERTYNRSIADGHSREETMNTIGRVVTSEIFDYFKQSQPYDQEPYAAALNALPELPWKYDDD
jgi:hypothetical protein